MDFRAHFLTLARYHVWATRRLLDEHVAPLAEADYRRDAGLFFSSIHGTLNHLQVGEHLVWFRRFALGESPQVNLDAEVEPNRQRLAAQLVEGAAQWIPYIESLPAERWGGDLEYTTMRGTRARLPFAATLAHVFNHATHHRGQISAALTAMGRPCPVLDMVYMLQAENAR